MERVNQTPETASGVPMGALKGFLELIQKVKGAAPAANGAAHGQLGAELAYKLAQAASQAKDPQLLKDSIGSLLDALQGIETALSVEKDK